MRREYGEAEKRKGVNLRINGGSAKYKNSYFFTGCETIPLQTYFARGLRFKVTPCIFCLLTVTL